MEYISYSVKMNVSRYPVRHISAGGQFCENEQFPFDRLCLEIKETHHCPFCDKGTVNSNCNCEKFATQLAKLQDSVGDEKHATLIHMDPYENLLHCDNDATVTMQQLSMQEVNELGPDFWDDAQKLFDEKCNRSFFVGNITYEGGKLDFICKDLQSKAVYRCSLSSVGYKNHKIYLGFFYRKTVSNGDCTRIGNYHFEEHWKDVAQFDDWNDFCEKIKFIWLHNKTLKIGRFFDNLKREKWSYFSLCWFFLNQFFPGNTPV